MTLNNFSSFIKQHNSLLLAIAGSIGVISTAIFSAKAAVRAKERIDKTGGSDPDIQLWVRASLPFALIPIGCGGATICCIVGLSALTHRNQATAIAAYGILRSTYNDYRKQVVDRYGSDADQTIRETLSIKHAAQPDISCECLSTICSQKTNAVSEPCLFYEEISGIRFESSVEQVIEAEYHLNRMLACQGCVRLNEFYTFLGLPSISIGDVLGWSVYNDCDIPWIDFNHIKTMINDDLECYIIQMPFAPYEGFIED